ncbi:MAG: peptide deformylase [Candidatus Hodgkinia cicadicola]
MAKCVHRPLACVNRLIITVLVLNACGVNSTQIGQPVGIIVTNVASTAWRAPTLALTFALVYTPAKTRAHASEGCLSVSSVFRRIFRHTLAIMIYIDSVHWRARALKTNGLLAACCQHELDHNHGRLIIDITGAKSKQSGRRIPFSKRRQYH